MVARFIAPKTSPGGVEDALRNRGYAVLAAADVAALANVSVAELDALTPSWDDLQLDHYLKDGGNYRKRRHSCFIAGNGELEQVPHRVHWQSLDYNALHGGMQRWFEPIEPSIVDKSAWTKLLLGLADVFSAAMPVPRWHIEAHQFRIDTSDGLGRPTPEGAHRDGVDFVAVLLVARHAIKGGETRVFQANGPDGQRFTLEEPWSMLLLDDARVIHESTPIQPLDDDGGYRDTLVLTFRAAGFQGDVEN
ncbi:MAG: 2OG-Fe dioxygenase family protein [Thermomonas sp.]